MRMHGAKQCCDVVDAATPSPPVVSDPIIPVLPSPKPACVAHTNERFISVVFNHYFQLRSNAIPGNARGTHAHTHAHASHSIIFDSYVIRAAKSFDLLEHPSAASIRPNVRHTQYPVGRSKKTQRSTTKKQTVLAIYID